MLHCEWIVVLFVAVFPCALFHSLQILLSLFCYFCVIAIAINGIQFVYDKCTCSVCNSMSLLAPLVTPNSHIDPVCKKRVFSFTIVANRSVVGAV